MKQCRGSRARHTGQSGELLVNAKVTDWGWRASRPELDVGADLLVEVDAAVPDSGTVFAIQVKTTTSEGKVGAPRRARLRKGSARHLRDCGLAAFVFHVERPTGRVRWLYLSELLDQSKMLEGQGAFSVQLPADRQFHLDDPSPPDALVDAIRQGQQYVAARGARPTFQHLAQRQRYLSNLDPDFTVEITASAHRERMAISGRTPLSFSMRAPVSGALLDALGWGAPATLADARIKLPPSRLWNALFPGEPQGKVEFVPDPESICTARVGRATAQTASADLVDPTSMELAIFAGTQGVRLVLRHAIAAIDVEIRRDYAGGPGPCDWQLGLPRAPTLRVGELAKLQGVASLLRALQEDAPVGLEPDDDRWGRRFLFATTGEAKREEVGWNLAELIEIYDGLESLGRIRGPSAFFDVPLEVALIKFEELEEWRLVEQLSSGQPVKLPAQVCELTPDGSGDYEEWVRHVPATPQIQTEFHASIRPGVDMSIPARLALTHFDVASHQHRDGRRTIRFTPTAGARIEARATGSIRFTGLSRS